MNQREGFEDLREAGVEREEAGSQLDEMERELRAAFRAVSPPAGFADAVLARAEVADSARGRLVVLRPRALVWTGAIAAALLASVVTGEQIHLRHQREAEQAQQQFEAGIRITDHVLEETRQHLQQAGIQLGD